MESSRKMILIDMGNSYSLGLAIAFEGSKHGLRKDTLRKVIKQLYSFKITRKDFENLRKAEKIVLKKGNRN